MCLKRWLFMHAIAIGILIENFLLERESWEQLCELYVGRPARITGANQCLYPSANVSATRTTVVPLMQSKLPGARDQLPLQASALFNARQHPCVAMKTTSSPPCKTLKWLQQKGVGHQGDSENREPKGFSFLGWQMYCQSRRKREWQEHKRTILSTRNAGSLFLSFISC